jgi:hypothetical protein
MLPKQDSTSRDAASAPTGSSSPLLHRIQNRPSAGMHRPQVDAIALGHQLALM